MTQQIEQIDVNDVQSVYSGKPGCCCGCLGKHTYAKDYRITASIARGYAVTDDEVSDRSVKTIVNKMNKLLASGSNVEFPDETGFHSIVHKNRLYIAYYHDRKEI